MTSLRNVMLFKWVHLEKALMNCTHPGLHSKSRRGPPHRIVRFRRVRRTWYWVDVMLPSTICSSERNEQHKFDKGVERRKFHVFRREEWYIWNSITKNSHTEGYMLDVSEILTRRRRRRWVSCEDNLNGTARMIADAIMCEFLTVNPRKHLAEVESFWICSVMGLPSWGRLSKVACMIKYPSLGPARS